MFRGTRMQHYIYSSLVAGISRRNWCDARRRAHTTHSVILASSLCILYTLESRGELANYDLSILIAVYLFHEFTFFFNNYFSHFFFTASVIVRVHLYLFIYLFLFWWQLNQHSRYRASVQCGSHHRSKIIYGIILLSYLSSRKLYRFSIILMSITFARHYIAWIFNELARLALAFAFKWKIKNDVISLFSFFHLRYFQRILVTIFFISKH